MAFLSALRSLRRHDPRPARRPASNSTYTRRASAPVPIDGKSGLKSSGGSGGLKTPSGPKDRITELVSELEALVKAKRVPTFAVAVMDARALGDHISQIQRVVAEFDAKIEMIKKLLNDRYKGDSDPVESAVRDLLFTKDQIAHTHTERAGLLDDWAHAIRVLEALNARPTKEAEAAAKAAASKAPQGGPKSGLLWIGGGGKDTARKNAGDLVAGNHTGASIKGDWKGAEFWNSVEASGAKYFAIDEGSDSWLHFAEHDVTPTYADYEAAYARLVGAVYGARNHNGGTSTLLFSVPDTLPPTGELLWVRALMKALSARTVQSGQVNIKPCKDGGSNSIVVKVIIGPSAASANDHNFTLETLRLTIIRLRGSPVTNGDGKPTGVYARKDYRDVTYDAIVRANVTGSSSSSSSSGQASWEQLQTVAAGVQYSKSDAFRYTKSAVASADRQGPASGARASADPLSTSTPPRFAVKDKVTFKRNLSRLGGTVISYNDQKKEYQIEWIHTNRTTHQFLVLDKDIIRITLGRAFENDARNQLFSKGWLIWFHRGNDSFQGKVTAYLENKSDPGTHRYTYSIVYDDENKEEKNEAQVDQIYLERR